MMIGLESFTIVGDVWCKLGENTYCPYDNPAHTPNTACSLSPGKQLKARGSAL